MVGKRLRVSVKLERPEDSDRVLAALEDALGRPVRLIRRFRSIPVLSILAGEEELETIRQIPGVRSAGPEARAELPPRPLPSRLEEK